MRRLAHGFAVVFFSGLLLAAKCVDYDSRLDASATQADSTTSSSGVTSTPCTDPKEAVINVEEYAFIVRCGCVEAPGVYDEADKRCTVPVGTKVTWVFEGSLQHNVASQAFDESRPRTAGRYSVTFDEPGVYPYECSLHVSQMSGYAIDVQAPAQ